MGSKAAARLRLYLASVLLSATAAVCEPRDPPVPAGADPGGTAIAIISTGFDYRLPDRAAWLARDGEGHIIGWDFIDNDSRPFDQNLKSSELAGRLLVAAKAAATPVRLVVMRVDTTNLEMRAKAVAFIARTPARTAVLPEWLLDAAGLKLLEAAAKHAPNLLLVVETPPSEKPGGKGPEAPDTTVFAGSEATDLVLRAIRIQASEPNLTAAQVKQRLISK